MLGVKKSVDLLLYVGELCIAEALEICLIDSADKSLQSVEKFLIALGG